MFKIERSPTGLFNFLKLRSMGGLPADMAEAVQPTLDITPWILETQQPVQTEILAAGAVLAPGLLSSFVTPQDWWLWHVDAYSIAAAVGDAGLLTVTLRMPEWPFPQVIAHRNRWGATAQITAAAAGEYQVAELTPAFQPMFLPAGSVLQVYASVIFGAPICTATVTYFPLS